MPRNSKTTGGALDVVRVFASHPWIVNSRNTADEDVVRTLASMAGVAPDLQHQIDSLDLVQDLIASGMGVGLLPVSTQPQDGVRIVPLHHPDLHMRTYAVTRRGRETWSPLRLLLDRLTSPVVPEGSPAAGTSSRESGETSGVAAPLASSGPRPHWTL